MHLRSDSFRPYDFLDPRLAFGAIPAEGRFSFGGNRNPHLAWSGAPEGTRSFALICHDPEVPSRGDDVNQEGRSVPLDLPRVDFFHWVLANLPASISEIAEGAFAAGITPKGKGADHPAGGGQNGINDYTGWFAGDPDMGGDYHGYDGPCPPWNDTRVHGYYFTVFAVDVPTLALPARFTGHDLRAALRGHVLAQSTLVGLYTMNRDL